MPLILFPAIRPDQPENPWLAELCSHCGDLALREVGGQFAGPLCACSHKGEEFAVITLLTPEEQQVWKQLTPHVPDHVIGRVLRVMYGREEVTPNDQR